MSKGILVGARCGVLVLLLTAAAALIPAVAVGAQFNSSGSPLPPTDATNPANFGDSVALSADGTTALVGGDQDNGYAGAAWVFTRSGSTWTQQGTKLTPNDEVGNGWFGSTVAISADGNTAVVGGRYDNGGVGAVWIFSRTGTTWTQTGTKLVASGESGAGQLGWALGVSADGHTIVAGAPGNDGNTGAAWIFTDSGGTWTQQELVPAADSSQFGWSTSISGDGSTVAVGGPDLTGTGGVWFYGYTDGTWTPQGAALVPSDATSGAQVGTGTALSSDGNTALVGAAGDNSSQGAAWIYTRSASTWSQATSKLVPNDTSGTASFGSSVGLSGDGQTAIIGGPSDNSAGAAWIYAGSGSNWSQLQPKLTASGTGNLGWGVAVSSDASTALAGSPGPGSGSAYGFLASSPTPPGGSGSGTPGGGTGGGGGTSPAVAVTSAPVVLSTSAAAFSGTVNPSGLATTAYFQYGLDASYGTASDGVTYTNSTAPQQIGAGSSPVAVSATVSGLVPNAVYHVRLVASNGAGTTYGADVTFKTKKDPLPPPPVLGKSFDLTPVAGRVLIRLPAAQAADSRLSGLSKGQGFIPLTEARQLPTGTQIDARQGAIRLVSAASQPHKIQTGTFTGGLYGLAQDRGGLTKGLTTLSLLEGLFPGAPSFSSCTAKTADPSGPQGFLASLSSKVLQTLHASAHGRFRTRGRYAAATVRGTAWTISDGCNGTLVTVQRHTVAVTDLVRHVTVLVHAGHRYLAKARRA